MTWPAKGPLVTPEKPVFPPSVQPVKSPVSKLPFVTRFVPAWAPKAAIVSDTTQAAVRYAFFIPLLPTLTEDLGPRVLPASVQGLHSLRSPRQQKMASSRRV